MSKHSYEEQKSHSSALIPHSFYRGIMPDYYPEITRHWHQEFELYLILEGKCCFLCGDKSFIAKEGDLILVQPNVVHAVTQYQNERVTFDIAVFHPRMITGEVKDRMYIDLFASIISGKKKILSPITVKNPYYTELRTSAETIFICSSQNSAYHDMMMKAEVLHIFLLLIDSGEFTENSQDVSETNTVLTPVIDYIKAHFHEELTIELLARTAHLSQSYFMGYFRKIMGMSAMKYIDNIRIEKVCELLRNTNESITQIASHCGFNNIANFNRHFQKAVGMTPSAYRKVSGNFSKKKNKSDITKTSIYDIKFSDAYCNFIQKAERKNRKKSEVDAIICWLTGYTQSQIEHQLEMNIKYGQFFDEAPQINPNCRLIKGIFEGMRVEAIEEPLMQKIRWLDKLIDELAKGKPLHEILRSS